jgi:hypothetical protein
MQHEDAASMAPGPNLSRRAFVEMAVASVAGASLVGLSGRAAVASEPSSIADDMGCTGQGKGGRGETIEYQDLPSLHQAYRS